MFLTTHLTCFYFLAAAATPLVQPQESQEPTSSRRRPGTAQRTTLPRNADDAKTEVRIYDLEYADPVDIAEVCQAVDLSVRVSANPSEGWLAAAGRAEDLETLESIIERLDIKGVGPKDTHRVVKLEHASARETVTTLRSVLIPRSVLIGIDARNNALILRGDPEAVEAAAALIEQLDQPSKPSPELPTGALSMDFFFLRGSIGPAEAEFGADLPKALREVAAALADSGFADIELMAPLHLVADQGSKFEQAWKIATEDQNHHLSFELSGKADYTDDGEAISATISAGVYAKVMNLGQPGQELIFGVETSLTTKLDEYLVLATAPATTAEAEAIVLVMRVSQR